MTPQKIAYRIWSAYKRCALFHNELSYKAKRFSKQCFCDTWMWNIIVITICLQPTH